MIERVELRRPGQLDIAMRALLEMYIGSERCLELHITDNKLRQFVMCSPRTDCVNLWNS